MPCPCQLCPSPEATVHLTEIAADGSRQELHLCRACVGRLHLHPEVEAPDVAQLRQQVEAPAASPAAEVSPPCETCGLPLQGYADTNLFGCPSCYDSFDQAVMALVEGYHGASRHQGRVPLAAGAVAPPPPARRPRARSPAAKRAALEARLRAAVAEERFEDAARLRDELHALTQSPPEAAP